jgi:hypothetical protein
MTEQTQIEAFVEELRGLVRQQIMPHYEWYWARRTYPRLFFRIAGVVVVIGSLMLPVIAAQKWDPRILTVVSLAVAISSSLSTFFRWDATWRSRTKAATELKGLLAKWDLALRSLSTAEKPNEAALLATQKLFDEAFSLIGSETEGFFANIKLPQVSKSP